MFFPLSVAFNLDFTITNYTVGIRLIRKAINMERNVNDRGAGGVGISRRAMLTKHGSGIFICAAGAAFFNVPGAFAEELSSTPQLTEGPYYPDKLPLDTDNDLIIIGNSLTPAVGQITQLSGRVLDPHGSPVRNATVEIRHRVGPDS